MNKTKIHAFQEYFFNLFIVLSYILIILSMTGLFKTAPKYLETMDYYIRIYICLFLIWRFNPFRTHYEFTNLDRKIAFSAGLFILTTTVLNEYIDVFASKAKELIHMKH